MRVARPLRLIPIWLVLSICAVSPRATVSAPAAGWTPLLDKSLSHWETYLSFRHKDGYAGRAPIDEKGEPVTPIGYNKDTAGVFTIVEERGAPVLRVSGEIYGAVFTRQEFEDYHLRLKVRWGAKKWEPRLNRLKDSGLLYHSVGESGVDYWRSWKLSQEFQIMQGHIGDFWPQAGSAIDIRAFPKEGDMSPVASEKQPFLAFGGGSPNGGFCMRSADYESPSGEWTEIELICIGDRSVHIVNGHVVMVLRNSRYLANGKATPLTKGKLQIQSEAAEVFFKDIAIRKLTAMPKAYASLFD